MPQGGRDKGCLSENRAGDLRISPSADTSAELHSLLFRILQKACRLADFIPLALVCILGTLFNRPVRMSYMRALEEEEEEEEPL